MTNKRCTSGFSLVELLISIFIISFLLFFSTLSFRSFFRRLEFNKVLRTITSALNLSRYRSIKMNRRIKFSIKNNTVTIFDRFRSKWVKYSSLKLEKVNLKMNSSPVFHPTGKVSPMCSIFIRDSLYLCRITLSITGRIKIRKCKL